MKKFYRHIAFLQLIITSLLFISCSDLSKSYCEEIINFSYTENDSLIESNILEAKKCAEKYHKRPEFLQKISQFYYYDAINNHSSEELSAISYQLSAKKLFMALDYINSYFSKIDEIKSYDYQYRGEIYELLGDIYKDINSLKPAAELYDNAFSDYEASKNNEKELNILIKIGKLYQYNHIPNIAMIYFEMAEEKNNIPNNIYRKIIDNKIVTFYELNDYTKADSLFKNHFNIKIQDYDFHSAIGTKYFYERNYAEALPHLKYCFENGSQQEKLVFSEKLAESYFNTNDHENEMFYIQHQAKNNSLEIRRTPLKLDLEKLYDINNHNITNSKSDSTNNNIIKHIIIISFSILIIIIITFITIKNKKQDKKIFSTIPKNIYDNKETTETKNETIDNIASNVNHSRSNDNFEDSYNKFCNSDIYNRIKSSFEGISILTKNVQSYSKLTLSDKHLILLTKTFNSCFPNAINSIKKDFPNITTNDIKFIILSFMNFNDVEIAVLLGLTYGASNKRSNKIKNIFNIKGDLSSFLMEYFKSNF